MQNLIQSMTMSMELRGFAKSTQHTYLAHLLRFQTFCGKLATAAGYDEVQTFLHHAITVRKVSSAYVNSAYGAIKFYYQSVLCREWNMLHVPRMKILHASGIAKDVSIHALRHSFATHSLNHGASILQIKELLGHSDIQTTSMYLHLTHAQVLGLKSPLDQFNEGDDDRA